MLLNELMGNIMPIQSTLNPKIWFNNKLDPEIADHLIEIGDAFVEFIGIDLTVLDYSLTGSIANFTWTSHSDIDLHIIIPGIPTDAERELYTAKKLLWTEYHSITIKGMPVECYIQGADEVHYSTGIYSIIDDKWITKPSKERPEINDSSINQKKSALVHQINSALTNNSLEQLELVKSKIRKMRKAGLETNGEWSTENLVFKILRNMGLIDIINNKIFELEDAHLSLEHID